MKNSKSIYSNYSNLQFWAPTNVADLTFFKRLQLRFYKFLKCWPKKPSFYFWKRKKKKGWTNKQRKVKPYTKKYTNAADGNRFVGELLKYKMKKWNFFLIFAAFAVEFARKHYSDSIQASSGFSPRDAITSRTPAVSRKRLL